jgi:Uncharacterized protein conserved in bacteria (DUF2252)
VVASVLPSLTAAWSAALSPTTATSSRQQVLERAWATDDARGLAADHVLERFVGKSTYPHHGQRVLTGQRLMQAATDIFLGWIRIKGLDGVTRDYYVRQFQDWKGSADADNMC